MPNRIKNWNYKKVEKFLKENGFYLNHVRGSHYYFNKGKNSVCVPFHGNKSIIPKTMNSIITQSGISKEIWFN